MAHVAVCLIDLVKLLHDIFHQFIPGKNTAPPAYPLFEYLIHVGPDQLNQILLRVEDGGIDGRHHIKAPLLLHSLLACQFFLPYRSSLREMVQQPAELVHGRRLPASARPDKRKNIASRLFLFQEGRLRRPALPVFNPLLVTPDVVKNRFQGFRVAPPIQREFDPQLQVLFDSFGSPVVLLQNDPQSVLSVCHTLFPPSSLRLKQGAAARMAVIAIYGHHIQNNHAIYRVYLPFCSSLF